MSYEVKVPIWGLALVTVQGREWQEAISSAHAIVRKYLSSENIKSFFQERSDMKIMELHSYEEVRLFWEIAKDSHRAAFLAELKSGFIPNIECQVQIPIAGWVLVHTEDSQSAYKSFELVQDWIRRPCDDIHKHIYHPVPRTEYLLNAMQIPFELNDNSLCEESEKVKFFAQIRVDGFSSDSSVNKIYLQNLSILPAYQRSLLKY
jgi:hypothetical protein